MPKFLTVFLRALLLDVGCWTDGHWIFGQWTLETIVQESDFQILTKVQPSKGPTAHYWTFWFQAYKISKNLRYVHRLL